MHLLVVVDLVETSKKRFHSWQLMWMSAVGAKDVGHVVLNVDGHPVANFSIRVGRSADETVARALCCKFGQVFWSKNSEEERLCDLTATKNVFQLKIKHGEESS